jgi:hypothetical protein
MQWAKLVSELIQDHEPQRILDLKARKWYFSILAASYGAKVDVLDDVDNAEYPDYLKDHPNITYYKWKVEDFEFKEKYDFIIVKHIVMYYPKDYVLWTLMDNIYKHLTKNWLCFITYHLPDSYTITNNTDVYQYCLDDFKGLKWKFVVKDFWNYTNPVSWEINKEHHVEYVVLSRQ